VAIYDWIDQEGDYNTGGHTDADCKSLRASWSSEILPKRIASCHETARKSPVSRPQPPVEPAAIALRARKPFSFTRYAPRSRTLGVREEAEIYDDASDLNGDDMRYSREDMPGTLSFVHRRIGRAAASFIGGGPVAAVSSFLSPGGGNGARRHAEIRRSTSRADFSVPVPKSMPCIWPARIDPSTGLCRVYVGEIAGPDTGEVPRTANGGRPVVSPGARPITRLFCPKGYILNTQNMCEWGLARNAKARKWRPGRKPLFTGGDLNAISKAASLGDAAEEIFKKTNPDKKPVSRSYRSGWRKPLKK